MANDDDGGLPAGGGNRSLEELRISHTILGRKVDSISNDLRQTIDTLRVVTENLRIREDRAPPVRRAYVSPMGARGQRRARRHVQPAPPEFSESDEEGIHHRRYRGCDSSSDEEVEQRILGEPRFAAQPRYLHHLQPPSPSFSSHHHLHTVDHIHTKPMTSLLCNKPITKYISNPPHPSPSTHSRTHSHIPNQFQSHHTRETHKTPNPKFDNTHENQFKTTETCSRFSPETHPPSQFRDQQNAINPICETQSIETHLQPQNSASTHDPCKKNQISQRRVLVDLDLHSSKEDYKSVAPLDSKNRQQHFDLSNSEIKRQPKTFAIENRGVCDSQFSAVASSEVNNNKQINSLLFDFAENENLSSCSAPNDNVKIQICQTHENLTGTNSNSKTRPNLPRNRLTTLIDMMQFVAEWFDFEENENDFCDELGDRVVGGGNSVQEKFVDCYDVVKNMEENVKNELSISENFTHLEAEAFELASELEVELKLDLVEVQRNAIVESGPHMEKKQVSWGDNYVWNLDDGFGRLDASGLCESPLIRKHPSSFYSLPPPDVTSNFQDEFGRHYIKDKEDIVADLNHCPLAISPRPSYLSLTEDSHHETTFNASMSFPPPGNHHWFMSKFPTERYGPFRWTIVLVPLWVWDELRRDFSVGVYHSHKPNMGLRSIVVLLVHFPRASTELEVEFFSKKGRLM